MMNRSAKDGARSSRHYGGEGVSYPPVVPRCVRAARYGRSRRDPGRARRVLGWHRDQRPYKSRDEVGSDARRVVGQLQSTSSLAKAR